MKLRGSDAECLTRVRTLPGSVYWRKQQGNGFIDEGRTWLKTLDELKCLNKSETDNYSLNLISDDAHAHVLLDSI